MITASQKPIFKRVTNETTSKLIHTHSFTYQLTLLISNCLTTYIIFSWNHHLSYSFVYQLTLLISNCLTPYIIFSGNHHLSTQYQNLSSHSSIIPKNYNSRAFLDCLPHVPVYVFDHSSPAAVIEQINFNETASLV